jgi:hypothetical protein
MDWESLLIGLAFLLGAFFLYKMRKYSRYSSDEELKPLKSVELFITWVWVITTALFGIGFVIHSL